jgi:nucleotide-binding universal stress UspA family protein
VEHIVTEGDAGALIGEYADRFHAELVVLGSPVNELTDEDFPTSTVLQVVSAVSCPVLCVPTLAEPAETNALKEVTLSC